MASGSWNPLAAWAVGSQLEVFGVFFINSFGCLLSEVWRSLSVNLAHLARCIFQGALTKSLPALFSFFFLFFPFFLSRLDISPGHNHSSIFSQWATWRGLIT